MDYYGDVAPNGDDVHTAQWLELVTVRVRPKRHEVKYVTSREACFTTSGDPGRVAYYLLLVHVNDLLTHVIEERPGGRSVLYEYADAHLGCALLSMAKPLIITVEPLRKLPLHKPQWPLHSAGRQCCH